MVNHLGTRHVQHPFGDVPSTGAGSLHDIHSRFVQQLHQLIESAFPPGAGESDTHAYPVCLEASLWGRGISDAAGKNICDMLDALATTLEGKDLRDAAVRILEGYQTELAAALKAACCFTHSTSRSVKASVRRAIDGLSPRPQMLNPHLPSSIKVKSSLANDSSDSLMVHVGRFVRLDLNRELARVKTVPSKTAADAFEEKKGEVPLVLLDAGL